MIALPRKVPDVTKEQFCYKFTFTQFRGSSPDAHPWFWKGLNEIYVWFLLPTYPNFFNPTLNIKMVFGEKIPKMGLFSDFVTIFFVKCYNKI